MTTNGRPMWQPMATRRYVAGQPPMAPPPCQTCYGLGEVRHEPCIHFTTNDPGCVTETCPDCKGTGRA